MTSKGQFSLFHKSGDQCRLLLYGFESIKGELADLADVVQAEDSDLMLLKVGQNCLSWVGLWSIRWQICRGDVPKS